jgi:hypothetical protein
MLRDLNDTWRLHQILGRDPAWQAKATHTTSAAALAAWTRSATMGDSLGSIFRYLHGKSVPVGICRRSAIIT